MNLYLQHLVKTAKLSAPGARSLEALIGAAVGGVTGGLVGLNTFKPEQPKEWLDPQGRVQGREWTRDERNQRLARAKKGALSASLVGAGGSLGASALRRGLTSRAERLAAGDVSKSVLTSLRSLGKDLEKARVRASEKAGRYEGTTAGEALSGFDSAKAKLEKATRRSEEAKRLLAQEEQRITDLLHVAKQERSKHLYGGRKRWFAGDDRYVTSPLTHRGQVVQHLGGPKAVKWTPAAELPGEGAGGRMLEFSIPKRYWMQRIIEKVGSKKLSARQLAKMREKLDKEKARELEPGPAIATDPFPEQSAPR